MEGYAAKIQELIRRHPLGIDTVIQISGRIPASASSEFLTNKEQGDWAERLVLSAINSCGKDILALPYGRSENISAGDPSFAEFYSAYQKELNEIGKKPDILLFRRTDLPQGERAILTDDIVRKAIAAIEVRSSSFLSSKYEQFTARREEEAECACLAIREKLLSPRYAETLKGKSEAIYSLLENSSAETFRELDFRSSTWSSSEELRRISELLRQLKENIRILHKRDYLSITPKLEDFALVNRWIQRYGVPHFYLQVFFDRGFLISFEEILRISSDPSREGSSFSVEKDVKNQGKTTVKINLKETLPVIGKIDLPRHFSALKELERGRLLFYVKFSGGRGFLDMEILESVLK